MYKDEIVSEKKTAGQDKATTSLVMGILGFLFRGIPVLGLTLLIIGIVSGSKAKKLGCDNNRGSAQAGFVLSIIGLILHIISMILLVIVMVFLINYLPEIMRVLMYY